jgi:hypothetical protein
MIIRKKDGSEVESAESISVGDIIEIKTPNGFRKGMVVSRVTKTKEQIEKELAEIPKR